MAHRHQLTHELIAYIVDPDLSIDIELFTDALAILKSISRFWAQVEIDIGSFEDAGAVDVDDVVPLALAVLQMCIDAFVGMSEDESGS